jgi:gluconate kinase
MQTRFKGQIAANFVTCLLNDDLKQQWLSVCKHLQDQAKKNKNCLSRFSCSPIQKSG